MANVQPYFLDTRVLKTPQSASNGTSLQNLESTINLLTYIQSVVTNTTPGSFSNGTVALPSITFTSDTDTGLYRIGANNIGVTANGAKVLDIATTGLSVTGLLAATTTITAGTNVITDNVVEKTSGNGVAIASVLAKGGVIIEKPTPVAINSTGSASAAQMVGGYITSTSASATSITTPTATAIAALIGAVRGTQLDLVIDNSAGANTVTLVLDASIAVVTPAITGGATLTVSTANSVGTFRIIFTSGTTAKIFRLA